MATDELTGWLLLFKYAYRAWRGAAEVEFSLDSPEPLHNSLADGCMVGSWLSRLIVAAQLSSAKCAVLFLIKFR